ncbi:class A beta-lactamase-related serine hydrolase [Streptomyces antnestii]|uniref:Class A beta-lactamase-related serine hydrolase n=1 Tax=Streptomyces antnestii TaxID=2494256 RepID=A0A3S2V954_9ACTN|nr:serine hydrolase domain-containing protein [Streptomyces sp. San01]RVU16993.1 class A beta-lactamase-related serine hydrolase [Streptomyces sp. San01]
MTHSGTRLRRGAIAVTAVGMLAVPAAGGAAFGASATTPAQVTATHPPYPPSPSSPSGEFQQLTPSVEKEIDAAVHKVMREAHVPGVTVGLWTPDKGQYVRSFGVADKSNGQKMAPGLYMRIGSETKTFTVTALLQLVDQHKVGLDDPIGRYIDGVPGGDRITVRQLAEMRSGLFNYSEDPGFFKALTSDPQRPFTPRQLLAYSFKHPVMFAPGEKFYYCNTNLILLGLVVEKESGQPLGKYIRDHVLTPAGMHHTLFPTGKKFPKPHAQGYTNQTATGKTEVSTDWDPSWAWAAGAMISTLNDLRTWAPTVATGTFPNGAAMISPATQKQRLLTPKTTIPGAGYGLGIFDIQGWIGHNGSLPGYESLTIYLPSAKATLVVLLNTDITHKGTEPSTLFGKAITQIVTPANVFDIPQPTTR